MGYFPNAIAMDFYSDEWCRYCVHAADNRSDDLICPVIAAHLRDNYDACNDKDHLLHLLIPRQGPENSKCNMFHEVSDGRCRNTPDMFGGK